MFINTRFFVRNKTFCDISLVSLLSQKVLCESLQRTHLQRPLLRMSPMTGDEISRGRNPENGRRRDFGRRGYRQSGFQYTNEPQPFCPESFNKNLKFILFHYLSDNFVLTILIFIEIKYIVTWIMVNIFDISSPCSVCLLFHCLIFF